MNENAKDTKQRTRAERKRAEGNPHANGNGKNPHFKPGNPVPWFAKNMIDHRQTLLGKRYLCRGGGMLIVAPSGLGKSTLTIQLAILWAAGLVAFGINPHCPRRILIIQAEDDQGDCTEMSAMFDHLGLTPAHQLLVWENTELIRCNDLTADKFIDALKARLKEARDAGKPFDLVMINPYSTYIGEDVQDTRANIRFLCNLLNPILTEFEAGALIVHHTPKTNFTKFDNFKPWDFQYAGAGSAAMTNWARAILVIVPQESDERLFLFVAAKRGRRIGDGWGDSSLKYFSHSERDAAVMQWGEATEEQRAVAASAKRAAGTSKKKKPTMDQVIAKCLSLVEWLSFDEIYEKAQAEFGEYGEKRLHGALNYGLDKGTVQEQGKPRPGTRPLPQYRRLK